MKRWCVVILVLLCIGCTASAHPGGLDKNGGHYVRTPREGYVVGEYHYHSGSGKPSDDNVIRAVSGSGVVEENNEDKEQEYMSNVVSNTSDTGNSYDAGYDEGYKNGKYSGRYSGYQDGKVAGYQDGKTDGYDEGYDIGHEKGYAEGYEAAKNYHFKIEFGIVAAFVVGCFIAFAVKKKRIHRA